MYKKIPKQRYKKFNEIMRDYFNEIGVVKNEGEYSYNYECLLNTKAGILYLSLDEEEAGNPVFSVYAKFSNVEKAKQIITSDRINPHSGKWNFHEFDERELFYKFKKEIKPLIENN